MARSGTGIGYTPSQTPTSMPGGFDEEQMAVARQRAMLTALANQPAVESGYRGAHYVNPYRAQIGPALLQLMNENAQPEMDAQLQDVARRRGEYTDQLLSNPPQMADIPADPGNAGPSEGPGMMGPPAPMPGYEGEPVVGDQNQMGLDYARAFAAKQRGMGQDAAINMETGAPTALADTQMQPLEAAPAAPMVPQAPQDFAPHRAATAMVPKWDMGRTMKWAGDLASASPMGAKIAEKVIDDRMVGAPARAEKAAQLAEDRAVRRAADKSRAEDRLADNARQERALQATINNQNATLEERRLARIDLNEVRRDANDIRRDALDARIDAAKEKTDADKKEITNHTRLYGVQLQKEKIPQLDEAITNVEKVIDQYKDQDIPGVGVIASRLPASLQGEDAVKARAPITTLRNIVTTSRAGLSQTENELRNVMEEMGLSASSSEKAFLEAIPRLRQQIETSKLTVGSSFRPEAVQEFQSRVQKARGGGAAPAAKAGDGWGIPTKR